MVQLAEAYFNDKKVKIIELNFFENKNNFSLSNLHLTKDYIIIDIEKIKL